MTDDDQTADARCSKRTPDTDSQATPTADAGAEPPPDLADIDADDLPAALRELRDRVAELEAGLQAVRGLLGEVECVDRDVERRAALALARTDDLRDRVAALEGGGESSDPAGTEADRSRRTSRDDWGRTERLPGGSSALDDSGTERERDGEDERNEPNERGDGLADRLRDAL